MNLEIISKDCDVTVIAAQDDGTQKLQRRLRKMQKYVDELEKELEKDIIESGKLIKRIMTLESESKLHTAALDMYTAALDMYDERIEGLDAALMECAKEEGRLIKRVKELERNTCTHNCEQCNKLD